MKNLTLLSVLLLLLPAVINSQSHKERITNPFSIISKDANYTQMFPEEQARGIKLPGVIQKNKKANKPSSVSYHPTKITCLDTLRQTFTYNSSGERLTEVDEIWTNNAWVNSYKSTYTYDTSGNELTNLYEYWDNNAWVNYYRNTYTYDNSGNQNTDLHETWASNTWVIYFRHTYTYDNAGNLLTDLEEIWTNNAWVNFYRFTYTYDNARNLLTDLLEFWTTNNAWVNSYRYTFTYDNSGIKLTFLRESWSGYAWVIGSNYKYTYTYDNTGNLLTELGEIWTNNAWLNNWRDTFTYDNNGNCIHGENYSWQNSSWVLYFGNSQIMYNHNKDSWSGLFSVVDVEYTTLEGVANESICVQSFNLQQNYPNPFNPSTTIDYSLSKEGNVKLTVFNALGSIVATIVDGYKPAGNYKVQFNGSNLASGIYLYRLESGNYSAVKKLILIK